ncbi:MAG: hypothetical protein EXQ85_00965 [Alphaproteobacteria bacterium]|nr:hypothetical protein [Alphaproteobacteria bacterium]
MKPINIRARWFGLVTVMVMVTACGGPAAEPPALVPAPPPPVQQQAALPPPLPPPAIPRFDTGPDSPPPHPRGLMGVEDRAVEALLGAPVVRRRDVGAQLWVYRSERCALQLFFYPEGTPERYFARHVETRPAARTTVTPERCFADFLRDRPAVRR